GLAVDDFHLTSSVSEIARAPLGDFKSDNESDTSEIPSLSRREMLILRLLMEGASNKSIALKLVITESTVKVHMKAVLRKLRLRNRTHAAIWARDHVGEAAFSELTTNGFAVGSGHHPQH